MRAWLGALVLLLASCATTPPALDILGQWTLAEVDGQPIQNGGWLEFGSSGELRAAIGCNTFTTRYELNGGRLNFVAQDAAIVAAARCSEAEAEYIAARDFPWDAPRVVARPSADELSLTSGTRTFRYVRAVP